MASAEELPNKEADSLADFNGRIFIVEGQKLEVTPEVLNVLIECSEYFRALLTSEFMESKQKEIQIEEVSAKDFKSFIDIMRLYEIYEKKASTECDGVLTANEEELVGQLMELVFGGSDILALILLADRFMVPGAIDLILRFLHNDEDLCRRLDVFDLIELAFKINNDKLKMLCLHLMKRTEPAMIGGIPHARSAEFSSWYTHLYVTHTAFFYYNRARLNELAPEIRAFMREKIPCVKDVINP